MPDMSNKRRLLLVFALILLPVIHSLSGRPEIRIFWLSGEVTEAVANAFLAFKILALTVAAPLIIEINRSPFKPAWIFWMMLLACWLLVAALILLHTFGLILALTTNVPSLRHITFTLPDGVVHMETRDMGMFGGSHVFYAKCPMALGFYKMVLIDKKEWMGYDLTVTRSDRGLYITPPHQQEEQALAPFWTAPLYCAG